jgi:hypothetical protein
MRGVTQGFGATSETRFRITVDEPRERRCLASVGGVAEELETARGLLASGDVPGLMRYLRAEGDALPLGEVARLVAAGAAGRVR